VKSVVKVLVVSALVASAALSLVGCAKKSGPVTLQMWVNGRDSYIGPDEQKKPQEEWYISQAIKRFEAKNPGVKVEITVPPDAAEAHQTFKAAGLAGNAPDIANLWSGQYIFPLKDVIQPLNSLVPKDDLAKITGWDTVTLDFKKGGTILGYPTPDNQMCFFLYNKKIIKDCGLDFDKDPPRTTEAFDAALAKIKAKGYVPMASDEGGFPAYYVYIAAYWWKQLTGIDQIIKENTGEAKFADDKGLLASLQYYHDAYAKGYVNKDAATSSNSWNKFLEGKVAMMPQVSTVVSDAEKALGAENVGAFMPPDMANTTGLMNGTIGGPGQCLVVSKNSKHPDIAVKLLSFLNSKAEVLEFYKIQSKVPVRNDISVAELNLKAGTVPAQLLEFSKTYTYWVDNSLIQSAGNDLYKLVPLVMVGKMTPAQLAAQFDKDVAADLASAKK
jgi:raffinose/stachyose/melibiose transport system substrate-binding protein